MATPVAEHASSEADATPTGDDDIAAAVDEHTGPWTVASAAHATATGSPGSTGPGSAASSEGPDLSGAALGLGAVGLIGAIAIGTTVKTSTIPSPVAPVTPRPVDPITPKPVDPIGPKPVDPITPKPVDPIGPKPVDPTTPINPVDPVTPITPVDPLTPAPSTFSISNAHVIEHTTEARELLFLVRRSGDTNQAGSVNFSVQRNKSTTAAEELTGVETGTVSFKAGESQQLIRLKVNGDYLRETDERVSILLQDPANGSLSRAEGDGTIHEVDVTRLQAAYGLRDLNPELDGAAIRVRRSSDSKELNIGFDAHGQLDRQQLLDFVGRTADAKGYVTRWYDQSGNGRDMTASVPATQGVIVDGGKIVTRADGSAAISFNAGRNGENLDMMTADAVAAADWRSAVIHANVQSEGGQNGTLFNLGERQRGRLSVHYPAAEQVSFDVRSAGSHRLSWKPGSTEALLERANNMTFEIHSGNRDGGTAALNYTDAREAIFENGHHVASQGENLPGEFSTTSRWLLASHNETGDGTYFQQAMYNEFLVYLAKDNSSPSVQNLIGTAHDDVLTYAGEKNLRRIDGLKGDDTLYVSGKTVLDLTQFSQGIKNIEQLWLENGEANTLKLTARSLSDLNVKALEIRLDGTDRIEIDQVAVPIDDTLMNRLHALSPTMQFKIVVDGQTVMG